MQSKILLTLVILGMLVYGTTAYVVPDVYLPGYSDSTPSNVGYYPPSPCLNCQPTPTPTAAPTYTKINLGISISPVKSTYKVGNMITLTAYQVDGDTLSPDAKFSWVYGTSKSQTSASGNTMTTKLTNTGKWSFQISVRDQTNYLTGVTKTTVNV